MKRKESGGKAMPDDAMNAIRKASEGLEYPSESDAPLEPFAWDAAHGELTGEALAALGKKGKKRAPRVQEVSIGDFFAALADSEDAARFSALLSILQKNLSDLKVFRVGATEVQIYIVGRTAEGQWLGLHTVSVET